MTRSTRRPRLALLGALLFWGGTVMTVLFVAAAVWLLANDGQPAWVLLLVSVLVAALGAGVVRLSRVPFSDALNIGF
jgi:hypothetical protein